MKHYLTLEELLRFVRLQDVSNHPGHVVIVDHTERRANACIKIVWLGPIADQGDLSPAQRPAVRWSPPQAANRVISDAVGPCWSAYSISLRLPFNSQGFVFSLSSSYDPLRKCLPVFGELQSPFYVSLKAQETLTLRQDSRKG